MKEYIIYLQEQRAACLAATNNDKEWAIALFDKVASPHYYWQQTQILKTEQPKEDSDTQPHDATDKMKRTIWGIVYGEKGQPGLETELTTYNKELNRFTITKRYIDFKWASDFIDKHKKIE